MADALAGLTGLLVILVVSADIFRSLLVPRANTRALRLGPLLSRALFPAWQGLARRISGAKVRQTMRASLAPLMLVLSLLIWAALLIGGFGLVFWADRAHFRDGFHDVGDAIYAAGTAFATLDVPDGVSGTVARTAVICCSLAGLAIVTVIATFLISIQAGFARRETLVLRLESHVTLPPAGIAILETYAKEEIVERLGAFFDAWEGWAAEVAISHRAFPILLLFRSNDSRCEWLAALGAVMDAAALLDATVTDAPAGAKAAAHFVLRTGARLVCDTVGLFPDAADGEEARLVDDERFDAHWRRLEQAGYTMAADRGVARRRFAERRRSFAPALTALGRRLEIDIDERRGAEEDSRPIG